MSEARPSLSLEPRLEGRVEPWRTDGSPRENQPSPAFSCSCLQVESRIVSALTGFPGA
jgi:hypothetical protein